MTDRQTDRRTGKNNMSPPDKSGGDIRMCTECIYMARKRLLGLFILITCKLHVLQNVWQIYLTIVGMLHCNKHAKPNKHRIASSPDMVFQIFYMNF